MNMRSSNSEMVHVQGPVSATQLPCWTFGANREFAVDIDKIEVEGEEATGTKTPPHPAR